MNTALTIDDLSLIYPEQLLLEFSDDDKEQAWQQIQKQNYSNTNASWNAYLNYLCLNSFLTYLKTETEVKTRPDLLIKQAELPSIWQVLNGTCLEIEKTRLVLIPSENSEFNQLQVSREWVEISTLVADYYLAVEISLEEGLMRVCGYATYQQLRDESKYDPVTETYSLDAEELIEDLTILWMMREPNPRERLEMTSTSILSATEIDNLLEKLSQPSPYSPRLNVPFEQWKVIIGSDRYRKRLYELQLQKAQVATSNLAKTVTHLGQWLQNHFELGWQSLNTLINSSTDNLAYSFRQKQSNFGEVVVEGTKIITLGERSLLLSIGLKPELDETTSIFVQLSSVEENSFLPQNLKLTLLSKAGKTLQEVQAREQDNLIQLKRFVCPKGKKFSIQVSLDELSILENFAIE